MPPDIRVSGGVQLGATDETHIIRAIEYWDIERRRYPQYDHCAVLIAEDVTSRFLNVISLFNGVAPFIALQMQAMRVGDATTLVFTKVMDEFSRGLVDEDEEATAIPTDRAYWEKRANKDSVSVVDDVLRIAQQFDPSLTLKFNKHYVGFARGGQPFNFVVMRPRKNHVILQPRLPETEDTAALLNAAGLEMLTYDKAWQRYRIQVEKKDVERAAAALREVLKHAYEQRDE